MKKLLLTIAMTLIIAIRAFAVDPSGTLPILYINIDNGEEVVEKEKYLNAQYWLDPKGCEGIAAIGSESTPLTTKIKGRGNWTWTGFDKKPYRLKLDKKQSLLGMKSSKHFGLLANADDSRGFLRNTVGFQISKLLGLPWTPEQQPVELVINGSYRGLYFATELIRIDKDRVNITEWQEEDESGNPLEKWVEGGSLVEIDNYPNDEGQVSFKDGNNWDMRITYDKSVDPGYEPDGYKEKLLTEFQKMNTLIFGDKNSDEIWNYIDIDDAARFWLVQEITNNYESMHGSCYMFKDLGEGQKWHYSPVWDFGSAFQKDTHPQNHFWQDTEYANHWAEELWKFPKLQQRAAEIYAEFQKSGFTTLKDNNTAFINKIKAAAARDKERWPNYGNDNLDDKLNYVNNFLTQGDSWLTRILPKTTIATDFVVPADEEGVYHVFFKKTSASESWETVKTYIYDSSNNHEFTESWPGKDCDYVKVDGNYYWHYELTVDDDKNDTYRIIFNNGGSGTGNQTANLKLRKRGVYTLDMAGDAVPTECLNVTIATSGTLPVLYINIENGAEVVEKETYLNAQYWLDPKGCEGIATIGSESAPLTTKIKGRGNYTWTGFDKKPYRLKLDKKQSLLGMKSSKHFGLLANADDSRAFLRNTVGFQLSKLLGLPWTPEQQPVELVINGSYRGLYFATELIRIDKDRVNITEWQEEDELGNPLEKWVEGGSLVEIDNYVNAEGQINFTDGDGEQMNITYDKSVDPGYEPDGYKEKLLGEFQKMNSLIFGDKNSDEIWNYLDIDDTARFLLVQDITNNYESMHGSCYMFKDLGEGQKWHYSPVWDFGSAFQLDSHPQYHFWDNKTYANHWSEELWKFPKLQERAAEIYAEFQKSGFTTLKDNNTAFINKIRTAAARDKERWPNYGNDNLDDKLNYVNRFISDAELWLNRTLLGTSIIATDFVVPKDEYGVYHVFFKKTSASESWETVNAYIYDSEPTGNISHELTGKWPGEHCDYVKVDGNYYWHYELNIDNDRQEKDTYRIIFNNGGNGEGNETANFKLVKRGVYFMNMTNDPEQLNVTITASGTLPILYINIDNGEEVVEKEKYLNAQYWLDPKGCEGIEAIGSESEPLTTKIKGRGNWTWTGFDKKPYRLKLDKKQSLLGMKSSKHFGLLANADDKRAFLRNTVGFQISKLLGLPWTPEQQPVELVINGSYRGLYFATELIRIDKDRVNITEWQEEDELGNPLTKWVEGGSLVEIDNYQYDEGQVSFTDGNNWDMRITYDKSVDPGYEPDGYKEKLLSEFQNMNTLIFGDKNSDEIWNYLDIDDTARYMLVQEITNNNEAMHGSCYMFKDLGEGEKWHYSPVWDFGSTFWRDSHPNKHFWEETTYQNHWAEELWKFPKLQQRAAEIWEEFERTTFSSLAEYNTDFVNKIEAAAACDKERWPEYGNSDLNNSLNYVNRFLSEAELWLNQSLLGTTIIAKDFVVPADEEGVYHVFFKQTGAAENWEKVYVYYWGDGLCNYTEWPGNPCNYVNVDGNYYWHYKITADKDDDNYHLIFNNTKSEGDNQTADLILRKRGVYTLGMGKDEAPTEFLPVEIHTGINNAATNGLTIKAANGAIIVNSDRAQTLDIVRIDGTIRRVIISEGVTTILLDKGFYIINGKKYLL